MSGFIVKTLPGSADFEVVSLVDSAKEFATKQQQSLSSVPGIQGFSPSPGLVTAMKLCVSIGASPTVSYSTQERRLSSLRKSSISTAPKPTSSSSKSMGRSSSPYFRRGESKASKSAGGLIPQSFAPSDQNSVSFPTIRELRNLTSTSGVPKTRSWR